MNYQVSANLTLTHKFSYDQHLFRGQYHNVDVIAHRVSRNSYEYQMWIKIAIESPQGAQYWDRLLGIETDPLSSENQVYLIFKYHPNSLRTVLNYLESLTNNNSNNKIIIQNYRRKILIEIIRQMTRGLMVLYNLNETHRSLTLDKVVIEGNFKSEIDIQDDFINFSVQLTHITNSWGMNPQWAAPEVRQHFYGEKRSAVYSLGIIFQEIYNRFRDDFQFEDFYFQSLIHSMKKENPRDRIKPVQVFACPLVWNDTKHRTYIVELSNTILRNNMQDLFNSFCRDKNLTSGIQRLIENNKFKLDEKPFIALKFLRNKLTHHNMAEPIHQVFAKYASPELLGAAFLFGFEFRKQLDYVEQYFSVP
eukprot:gb/GECH01001641.1/.p1 GENE.gb/GECH01001641.1/~~gb/GECH01001641.1/.p1  ORF type:complete len:363 (+),score=99.24 gb/GECH01001641.1/:1-1089(+)